MPRSRLLLAVLALLTLALVVLGAYLGISDQEAYYWAWSRQLELCYFEHPPLQAWLTRVFTDLLGNSAFVLRLPATLGRLAALWIFWRWARWREGERAAEASLWILAGAFFMLAGGVIALPDVVMLPFALWAMWEAERGRAWQAGVALGIAALGKWTAALLIPGVSAAFLLHPTRKRDVRGWVVCGGVALLLQTPVLWWNAHNDWASFLFHLQGRHAARGVQAIVPLLLNLSVFALSQVALGGFSSFPALLGWWRSRSLALPKFGQLSLAWWIVPAFVIFAVSAARGEIRFYWTVLSFFPLTLALGRRIAQLEARRYLAFERQQVVAAVLGVALLATLLLLPVGAYVRPFTDTYKSYDMRHSAVGDFEGWRDWVELDLRPEGLVDATDVVIVASDFRLAAQAAWALGRKDMRGIATINPQMQFEFWPKPTPAQYPRALLFQDNRRQAYTTIDTQCAHPVVWRERRVMRFGHEVKRIGWALCTQYRPHPI